MGKISLSDNLFGIAIGIRYRPNFAIEDKIGEIADELLYRKDSLFNYLLFPRSRNGLGEKILNNPDTGDSIVINRSNLVLDISFSDELPKTKADDLINEFLKTATEKIYKVVNIHDVLLIGIVKKYIINDNDKISEFNDLINKTKITNINSYNLTFTKKIILADSKLKDGLNDYENIIHSIVKNPDKDEILFQIDYQHVYDPKLESIVDIKYKEFLGRVNEYNNKTINDWMNS